MIQEHPKLELTALPQDPQFLPLAPHHLLPPLLRNRWSRPPPLLKEMRSPRDVIIGLIKAVRAALGKAAGAAAATTAGAAAVVAAEAAAAGMAAATIVAMGWRRWQRRGGG